jgi:hypothetical protein
MAGLVAAESVIGAGSAVWVAPVGTTPPADEVTAPGAGWINIGHVSDQGLTWGEQPNYLEIRSWMAERAIRRYRSQLDDTVSFSLLQWNKNTLGLALRGAVASIVTAGHFRLDAPAAATMDPRALMIDWIDVYHYRAIYPKGDVTQPFTTTLARTAAGMLPIGFQPLVSDSGIPWYLLSDNPALSSAYT